MAIKISVTDAFDGGNIQMISQSELVHSQNKQTAECTITLQIKPDVFTESENAHHMQYFAFRTFVSGISSDDMQTIKVKYEIANARDVSFPYAWPGTTICYTTKSMEACDDGEWKRNLTTEYLNGKLIWTHDHHKNGSTFFSYYPPFTYNRHLKLISDCVAQYSRRYLAGYNPTVESLGQTTEGREVECISIGNGNLIAWVIHRQHPGETMAEFYAEGLLHRLLGLDATTDNLDDATKRVLTQYRLYIVPCMCPDGAVRGHIRTNGMGANLNREWASTGDYVAPTLSRSPEAYGVLNKMDATGCDFFLDVHGGKFIDFYCN